MPSRPQRLSRRRWKRWRSSPIASRSVAPKSKRSRRRRGERAQVAAGARPDRRRGPRRRRRPSAAVRHDAAFLEQFALRHLEELPRADELAIALRAREQETLAEVVAPEGAS